jgi:hypothetical protein
MHVESISEKDQKECKLRRIRMLLTRGKFAKTNTSQSDKSNSGQAPICITTNKNEFRPAKIITTPKNTKEAIPRATLRTVTEK